MSEPLQTSSTTATAIFSMKLEELTGTVLEQRYRLGRILGSGGMGAVFKATHIRLRRDVAIKVLRPKFIDSDEYMRRFVQEAQIASRIRHPNVVEILDYGEVVGGLVYSVMELLEGQDLEELLRTQPGQRLPWARACGLLIQIASGLNAAHEQGIVHRDVKPANCFLVGDGDVVKVLDFGIARLEEPDQDQRLTSTGHMVGTPKYIAPELVRNSHRTSPRSDIYSLGVLAYRMLTGRVPFEAESCFDLMQRICNDPVPPARQLAPEIPGPVEGFMLELLAKDPDKRPSSMNAVRERLLALDREVIASGLDAVVAVDSIPIRTGDTQLGLSHCAESSFSPSMAPAANTQVAPEIDLGMSVHTPTDTAPERFRLGDTSQNRDGNSSSTRLRRPDAALLALGYVGAIAALGTGALVVLRNDDSAEVATEPETSTKSEPSSEGVSTPAIAEDIGASPVSIPREPSSGITEGPAPPRPQRSPLEGTAPHEPERVGERPERNKFQPKKDEQEIHRGGDRRSRRSLLERKARR